MFRFDESKVRNVLKGNTLQSTQYVYVSGCSKDYCVHARSKQSPSHLRVCLKFCDVSCSHLALAWLVQHRELKKEQSSLAQGWDTFLSHPLSLRSTCSVSRWDQEGGAVEGIGRVQLEAGTEVDEGLAGKWEGGGLYTADISPSLKAESRHLLSWFDFLLCRSSSL